MVSIRNVQIGDLTEIAHIEQLCFEQEEAASEEVFRKRIHTIPDSFFVAEEAGAVAGFIQGPAIGSPLITDDLFGELKANPPSGGHLSVLGLAVAPAFQNRGIAARLLERFEKEAEEHHRSTVTLTCKKQMIGFYEKHGYSNIGKSDSKHGGAEWYNMVKRL